MARISDHVSGTSDKLERRQLIPDTRQPTALVQWRRLILLACTIVACTEIDTGPNVVASLEFESLPFPAVVAGDTLRDTSGVVAPLRAIVFNPANDEISGAPVRYAALEPVVTVDSITGIVVAGATADTAARVIASIGALQSAPLRLSIVRRPDSLERVGAVDTLRYSVTDTTVNVSEDLAVRVLHRATLPGSNVRDWIVTFALQAPADSVRAVIIGDNQRRSTSDTTAADGRASRRVRVLPAGLASGRDSVVVLARARYRGTDSAGSPARFVVHFQPRVQ